MDKIKIFSTIIITHGTDTMIKTAQMLRQISDKVIVLTGALQPAAFKQTDAAFNVGGAIVAAQILPAGVYIIMNGRVLDPDRCRKNVTAQPAPVCVILRSAATKNLASQTCHTDRGEILRSLWSLRMTVAEQLRKNMDIDKFQIVPNAGRQKQVDPV